MKNDKKDPGHNGAESEQKIIARIARIEGQLKGISRMIGRKDVCIDIISQVLAVREAVGALGVELLKNEFVCRRDESRQVDESYLKTLFKMN